MPNANDAAKTTKLRPSPPELEFFGNAGSFHYQPAQFGSQVIRRSGQVAKGVYDFTIQGGAVGNANLYDCSYAPTSSERAGLGGAGRFMPLIIPGSAIITRCLIDVVTAALSGGAATVAFSSGVTAADLRAATAKATLSIGALLDGIPANTAATSFKVVAATGSQGVIPFCAIATAALTAGKWNVHIEYLLSD